MLSEGATLRRGYTIERILGQGGMGTVYLARQTNLGGRLIALKEIHLEAVDPEAQAKLVELLKREAHILASLDHPGIVRVLDFFEEDGLWFMSMDYIEGSALQDLCKDGPVALERVYDWADQLCDILSWLHERQPPVIVRDLKPSNLLLTPAGRIRLIDFGIASVRDTQARTATVLKGSGTVGYAPVEQFGMKASSDARGDIYALGATLYSLVTGEVPPFSLDLATGDAELIPPRDTNTEVPDALERAHMKMMALKREHRYQTLAEIREVLAQIRALPAPEVVGVEPVQPVVEPVAPAKSIALEPAAVAATRAQPFNWGRAIPAMVATALCLCVPVGLYAASSGAVPVATPTPVATPPAVSMPSIKTGKDLAVLLVVDSSDSSHSPEQELMKRVVTSHLDDGTFERLGLDKEIVTYDFASPIDYPMLKTLRIERAPMLALVTSPTLGSDFTFCWWSTPYTDAESAWSGLVQHLERKAVGSTPSPASQPISEPHQAILLVVDTRESRYSSEEEAMKKIIASSSQKDFVLYDIARLPERLTMERLGIDRAPAIGIIVPSRAGADPIKVWCAPFTNAESGWSNLMKYQLDRIIEETDKEDMDGNG